MKLINNKLPCIYHKKYTCVIESIKQNAKNKEAPKLLNMSGLFQNTVLENLRGLAWSTK